MHPFRNSAEDTFLQEQTENILESLELLHKDFCSLTSPVSREYQLEPFSNGRYGFFDNTGRKHELSCGNSIEAKIPDRYGRQRFIRSRIEHDGSDYFLWEHMDIPLAGLTIRKREVVV